MSRQSQYKAGKPGMELNSGVYLLIVDSVHGNLYQEISEVLRGGLYEFLCFEAGLCLMHEFGLVPHTHKKRKKRLTVYILHFLLYINFESYAITVDSFSQNPK